jgi:hypothetical protein
MEIAFRDKFLTLWKKYFNNADLPIIFYYTDKSTRAKPARDAALPRCIIGALASIRDGQSYYFGVDSLKCGQKYLGFPKEMGANFRYFLSCGLPGKTRGERYVKSPEMVDEIVKNTPSIIAPHQYIVFKRWDKLTAADTPEVVIFFAIPDVLAGLYTLARFDETDRSAIQAPFSSGCASIVQNPYLEQYSEHPKAIIGLFDPSARICVPKDVLTIAIPMKKFVTMVNNIEESFLTTDSWRKIQQRIK